MSTGRPMAIHPGAFNQSHTATTMASQTTRPTMSMIVFFTAPPSDDGWARPLTRSRRTPDFSL